MYKKGDKVYFDNWGEVKIATIVAVGEEQYEKEYRWFRNEKYMETYYIVEWKSDVYHNGQVATKDALSRRKITGEDRFTKYDKR